MRSRPIVPLIFFFKQKTAYEMRISDWSSDVCSSDLLGQVIRNLIDNAISFSPTGGTITVAVRREPRHVVFTVTDDGPGIPAENLESIFDRFYSERPSSEALDRKSTRLNSSH